MDDQAGQSAEQVPDENMEQKNNGTGKVTATLFPIETTDHVS